MPVPELISCLAEPLRAVLAGLDERTWQQLEEVRLRKGRPLMVTLSGFSFFLTRTGKICPELPGDALIVTERAFAETLAVMTKHSLYAVEEQVRSGFLTLSGGHRAGLVGRAVVENGQVRSLQQIGGINLRFGRAVPGIAVPLLPYLLVTGRLQNTLLLSAPGAGKTTLLRDLVRCVSTGVPGLLVGLRVGVVDERSEIAGCQAGVPQHDLGPQTDVLDSCPKAEGIMMLLRAMSPQVVACDEVGSHADVQALLEALHAGVIVLATVHAGTAAQLQARPVLRPLFEEKVFQRLVLLGRSQGVGTIEAIYDDNLRPLLKRGTKDVEVGGGSVGDRRMQWHWTGCGGGIPAPTGRAPVVAYRLAGAGN